MNQFIQKEKFGLSACLRSAIVAHLHTDMSNGKGQVHCCLWWARLFQMGAQAGYKFVVTGAASCHSVASGACR